MPYIGRGSDFGVRSRFIYTATAGQTTFSGNDDAGISLAYTDTLYIDVYQNGVLLVPATDYASTTGTSVVLVQGASVDDTLELLVHDIFSVADAVSAKDGGSFAGNVGMGGTLAVTGTSTLTGALDVGTSTSGIINLKGGSSTSSQMRFFDGGTARARIGVPTGQTYLSLSGSDTLTADVAIASDGKVGFGIVPTHNFNLSSAGDVEARFASTDGDCLLQISSDTDEGKDSTLAFLSGSSARGSIIYNHNTTAASQTMIFKTGDNAITATTIDGAGNIFFNSTDASGDTGRVFLDRQDSNRTVLEINNNTGGGTEFMAFRTEGTKIGSITQNGASNTAFNTSSDYRLKENIALISDGISRLKQLKPSRFSWIVDDTNTLQDGFIAHEVSPVIPEAVLGEKDAVFTEDTNVGNDKKGVIKPQALDYSKLTPLLTAALQEAIAKIEVLETKVAALEAK